MRRATPRVSQILETSLYVEDLDRSRRFYERLFGFTAIMHDERMCAMEVPGEQVLLLFRHGMTDEPAPMTVFFGSPTLLHRCECDYLLSGPPAVVLPWMVLRVWKCNFDSVAKWQPTAYRQHKRVSCN